jgi:hypothetical protein
MRPINLFIKGDRGPNTVLLTGTSIVENSISRYCIQNDFLLDDVVVF